MITNSVWGCTQSLFADQNLQQRAILTVKSECNLCSTNWLIQKSAPKSLFLIRKKWIDYTVQFSDFLCKVCQKVLIQKVHRAFFNQLKVGHVISYMVQKNLGKIGRLKIVPSNCDKKVTDQNFAQGRFWLSTVGLCYTLNRWGPSVSALRDFDNLQRCKF